MLLRNKKDGCIYDVTTEYSEEDFEVYSELHEVNENSPNRHNVHSYAWTYTKLKDFYNDWEDVD